LSWSEAFPPVPGPHAIATLLLTALALFLFSRDRIPVETSSLFVLVALALGFSLFPYETPRGELDPLHFFHGFSNEALIAICALIVASQGLVRTGALAPLGRLVARLWNISPLLAFAAVLVSTTLVSAFMNNTPQVVLMIPILTSVALRAGTSPSKTLLPMTYASQLGGMGTPIGTSLNLLVIGTAATLGVPRFDMFDFIQPAMIGAAVGLVFLCFLAPRLLPARQPALEDASPRVFTAQISIPPDSPLAGEKLSDVIGKAGGEMTVRRILRKGALALAPLPDTVIAPNDQLVVRDTPERLMEYATALDARLYSGEEAVDEQHPLKAPDQQIAEIVVTQESPLNGRTLDQVDYDERYHFLPIAIHRPGQPIEAERRAQLRTERLRTGDVLLVQAPAEQVAELKRTGSLLVLDATADVLHTSRAPVALAIMAGIVLAATLRIAPIAIAALVGVMLMVVTGCLRWRDASRSLDSGMILLTVAALALSFGLVQTGGAAFLAKLLVQAGSTLPPVAVLSGLMLLMAMLSNIVSNTSAAVIGTPIAVEIARQLGLAPEPFVLAVLFGVNMGFATPMADNCNLIVYGAGGYTFRDFLRVGIPLTLVVWITLSLVLPRFFPLHAPFQGSDATELQECCSALSENADVHFPAGGLESVRIEGGAHGDEETPPQEELVFDGRAAVQAAGATEHAHARDRAQAAADAAGDPLEGAPDAHVVATRDVATALRTLKRDSTRSPEPGGRPTPVDAGRVCPFPAQATPGIA
jgi:di/tricarboxylate transporter